MAATSSGGPPYSADDLTFLQRVVFHKDVAAGVEKVRVFWHVGKGKKQAQVVPAGEVAAAKRRIVADALRASRSARKGDPQPKRSRISSLMDTVDVLHLVSYTEAAVERTARQARTAAAARQEEARAAEAEQQAQVVPIGDINVPLAALQEALRDPAVCTRLGVSPTDSISCAVGGNVRALLPTVLERSNNC
jgi:hypothetical protein